MAKIAFTAGRVSGFKCPPGKLQAFLWDATVPGLALRATAAGQPAYVFQGRYQNKSLRVTIGSPGAWRIPDAQGKARELQRLIDEGRDPREVKAERTAADVAKRQSAKSDAITMAELWANYLAERRPHWGERHYRDHVALGKAGGVAATRGTSGKGQTIAGPIFPLLAKPLADLTPETIEAWATKEARTRPTYGRLAWRCLKAFLGWCAEQPAYRQMLAVNPAKTKKAREAFGKPAVKSDVLQRDQLTAWFGAVRGLNSPVVAAYLQTLLLIGARPGEVLAMRWVDVNTKWKGVTIRDKVEGERVVPLTPYVAQLLHSLPRRSEWVFLSPVQKAGQPPRPVSIPRNQHVEACQVAGIDGLTLHGLRRSFKSLTEWLEIPAGVVAQIMGHKPSATAEKHYTVRPLDLLRVHHERIEAWILEQAGVAFDAKTAPGALRAVN